MLHKSAALSLDWSQTEYPDRRTPLSFYALGRLWQILLRLGVITGAEIAPSKPSHC